jgi:TRAP-type C4-dicarboxylate transport system permease small subunit
MREILRRGAVALMAVLRAAAGAMLITSVGINFANIIGRYFLSVSLSWAEEAMLFLMIGCVFAGVGPVGWMGRHIRMDVVVSLLPPQARAAFELFSDLVTIATCVALAIFAWPVMTMLAELDQRSDSANIPMVIPQAAVPLGLLLMALLIAVRLYVHGVRHDDVISSRGSEH